MIKKFILGCFIITPSFLFAADQPTVIYSAAERPNGGKNVFVVSQPENINNPLGNPIIGQDTPPQDFSLSASIPTPPKKSEPSDPQPVGTINDTPIQEGIELGKDFQNTLVEGSGRIYDIQSYPVKDVNVMSDPANPQTIYSPNVND